jgi:hypothetical protein
MQQKKLGKNRSAVEALFGRRSQVLLSYVMMKVDVKPVLSLVDWTGDEAISFEKCAGHL